MNTFFRGGMVAQPEPSKSELHCSRFDELAFWLTEVIETVALFTLSQHHDLLNVKKKGK